MRVTGADSDKLRNFLRDKRWFGDKDREILDARIDEPIPVEWPNAKRRYGVTRVTVRNEAGSSRYQIFVRDGDGLEDALADDDFRRGLADAFQSGARFEKGDVAWVVESETRQPLVIPPGEPIALSKAEQSNSSLILGKAAILKLFRKLERGINPDVEVTRFLTIEKGFPHTPALLGCISFEEPGGSTVAGMLQELVPGAQDGWKFALERATQYIAGKSEDDEVAFAAEARQLGEVTRGMHETLASGDKGSDFERKPATAEHVRKWAGETRAMMQRALATLRRALESKDVPSEIRADAERVAASAAAYDEIVSRHEKSLGGDAGSRTRTHGDYHLGQVLRSASRQFLVIDFEGEPARPLSERRAMHSPLRDVAGMLRSVSYCAAAASGAKEGKLPPRAAEWEREVRRAFLDGYHSAEGAQRGLLPATRAQTDALIQLFEIEKAFYELQYELGHRPDWVWIPMRAIAALST